MTLGSSSWKQEVPGVPNPPEAAGTEPMLGTGGGKVWLDSPLGRHLKDSGPDPTRPKGLQRR